MTKVNWKVTDLLSYSIPTKFFSFVVFQSAVFQSPKFCYIGLRPSFSTLAQPRGGEAGGTPPSPEIGFTKKFLAAPLSMCAWIHSDCECETEKRNI